jgi:arylsulfatase A-like enzyme
MAPASRSSDGRAPDVLVVVMDCVRASEFPGSSPDPVPMPFAERLRRECVVYPRAVSVAPWTLPSHASIFTGLYPWEHGCHGKGTLRLDPKVGRLASVLSRNGYSTASISANPIISPSYGLVDGFDYSAWGEWWEQVHRWRRDPTHIRRSGDSASVGDPENLSARDKATRQLKLLMQRVPASLSLLSGIGHRIADPERRYVGNANPWIEPVLREWLMQQPASRPTYCFVNVLDAHEPYLLDLTEARSLLEWWRSMRFGQDALAVLEPPSLPPENMERMHELYRRAIAVIDARLERIVSIYREAGRWDDTLLVLTSDHGQGFGEHGMIWHGVSIEEEMLRVPLWAHFPQGEHAGELAQGWATPMDAAPTILRAAGFTADVPLSGVALQDLVGGERPAALYAAGDGTEWNRPLMAHLPLQRQKDLNVFAIAGYLGSTKVAVDAVSGAVRGWDLSNGRAMPLADADLGRPELEAVIQGARRAAGALMNPSAPSVTEDVDDRLRSWGYG